MILNYMTNQKILLVEDSDDDAVLMYRAFRKQKIGTEIVRAKNGFQALSFLFGDEQTPKITPALVILDVKLPKLSGLDVLKSIRANQATKGLPVIMLTTSDHQEDIFRAYDLGTNSYIRKPIEFDKFVDAVGQIGLYWLELNEPLYKAI